MTTRPAWLLSTPALVLLGCCVLGPLILLIRFSFYESGAGHGFYRPGTFSLENYQDLARAPRPGLIAFTVGFALAVTLLTLALAYPLALFINHLPSQPQAWALALALLPRMAGVLASLFGWQRLLPRGLATALLAEAAMILPYSLLVLVVQFQAIDPNLVAAARGLGASSWATFVRILWPLSRPGLLVAGELALVWGLGAFLGPLFLAGPQEMTLAVDIHRQAFDYGRWPRAAAEAVLLLFLVALVFVGGHLSQVGKNRRMS